MPSVFTLNLYDTTDLLDRIDKATKNLNGKQVVAYAESQGWAREWGSKRSGVALLTFHADRYTQIAVPLDRGFSDYHEALAGAVMALAKSEQITTIKMAEKIERGNWHIHIETHLGGGDV